MEGYSPSVESQLLALEKPYKVKASAKEGEKVLAKLAAKSELEYAWMFDEETSTWHYSPPQAQRLEINVAEGTTLNRVTSPDSYHYPPSQRTVDYHIHPTQSILTILSHEGMIKDGWEMETMLVNNQTPSAEDYIACARRHKLGVVSSKIVTPLGVTIIEFHPEKTDGVSFSMSLSLSRLDTIEALERVPHDDMTHAIESRFAYINEKLEGVFTVSFQKFSS